VHSTRAARRMPGSVCNDRCCRRHTCEQPGGPLPLKHRPGLVKGLRLAGQRGGGQGEMESTQYPDIPRALLKRRTWSACAAMRTPSAQRGSPEHYSTRAMRKRKAGHTFGSCAACPPRRAARRSLGRGGAASSPAQRTHERRRTHVRAQRYKAWVWRAPTSSIVVSWAAAGRAD